MSFLSRLRDTAKAVIRAVRNPSSYAPPPLPTEPPAPRKAATPRRDRQVERRPEPRTTRYIPRRDLPASWGPHEAALWSDAMMDRSVPESLKHDENAQRFYDAALYTRSEEREQRAANLRNFKQYIADEYGVDWDEIFDWDEYRLHYDTTGASV